MIELSRQVLGLHPLISYNYFFDNPSPARRPQHRVGSCSWQWHESPRGTLITSRQPIALHDLLDRIVLSRTKKPPPAETPTCQCSRLWSERRSRATQVTSRAAGPRDWCRTRQRVAVGPGGRAFAMQPRPPLIPYATAPPPPRLRQRSWRERRRPEGGLPPGAHSRQRASWPGARRATAFQAAATDRTTQPGTGGLPAD